MEKIVLIEGTRTPFLKSGTDYKSLMSYELGSVVIKSLINKCGINPNEISTVIFGNVISNVRTTNVAREAALSAGMPSTVPCSTVSLMCISANRAIANGIEQIKAGKADLVIAGGVDNVSDISISYKKSMQRKLFAAQKLKSVKEYLQFALTLRPKDFLPDVPKIAEYATQRTMGQDCDRMCDRIGIDRKSQDEFAVRSHLLTADAFADGIIQSEITPVEIPPNFTRIERDNGFRKDSSAESLAKLKPAFAKPFGTLTAANSSFLTDGAAAVLICTETKAKQLGLQPKAYINDYCFTAQDLNEELLLGPAYSIAKLLDNFEASFDDIGVFEIHEAFAGQVLANLKCLASDKFCQDKLNRLAAVGNIPLEKLNIHGGSLSIGHPFGATGARLVTTTANRMIRENQKWGILAACAAGAHGHAMILENYN